MNRLEPNLFIRQSLLEGPEDTKFDVKDLEEATYRDLISNMDPNTYYHSTNDKFERPKPKYPQIAGKAAMKPQGFWAAKGNEWVSWCSSEMPHWLTRYIYKLDVDVQDPSILKLTGSMRDFGTSYVDMTTEGNMFVQNYNDNTSLFWKPLENRYKGIAVDDPHGLSMNDYSDCQFLYSWDVSSIVLWDTSVLKGYTLAYEYNEETKRYEKRD